MLLYSQSLVNFARNRLAAFLCIRYTGRKNIFLTWTIDLISPVAKCARGESGDYNLKYCILCVPDLDIEQIYCSTLSSYVAAPAAKVHRDILAHRKRPGSGFRAAASGVATAYQRQDKPLYSSGKLAGSHKRTKPRPFQRPIVRALEPPWEARPS